MPKHSVYWSSAASTRRFIFVNRKKREALAVISYAFGVGLLVGSGLWLAGLVIL